MQRAAVILTALAAGVVAAVLALGGSDGTRPAAATGAATRVAGPPAVREVGRTADGRYKRGFVHLRVLAQTTRRLATAADPAGGDGWAVRTFDADRVVTERTVRSLRGARVVSRGRCTELGRVRGDRFGWVYAGGRFVAGVKDPARYQCGSRVRPVDAIRATRIAQLPLTDPARLGVTAVWGRAPGARSVSVAGAPVTLGRDDAMLALLDRRATIERQEIQIDGRALGEEGPSNGGLDRSGVVPGSRRIAAQTDAPGGGDPYGVGIADTAGGGRCVGQSTRVVDGLTGVLNRRTGIFQTDLNLTSNCRTPPDAAFTPEVPCAISTSGGFGRRLVVSGSCADDVRSLTIGPPRDRRPLIPSADGHAFIAVFTRAQQSGRIDAEITLADGTTRRLVLGR